MFPELYVIEKGGKVLFFFFIVRMTHRNDVVVLGVMKPKAVRWSSPQISFFAKVKQEKYSSVRTTLKGSACP
jgi:hypothetical protein